MCKRAALYAKGRVVIADSHLQAYQQLTQSEQNGEIVSGVFNVETQEFQADCEKDHFYNKQIFLIRHGEAQEPLEPDPPISDAGTVHIQQLAEFLSAFDLKNYIGLTSPLLRCLQSAKVFYETLHIDFQICPEVIETACFLSGDQHYRLQNYRDMFPQFQWPSEDSWILTSENEVQFISRIKLALQNFPTKTIVMTHCGFIYNVTRLALCEQKIQPFTRRGVPPASATFLDRQEIKFMGRTCEDDI